MTELEKLLTVNPHSMKYKQNKVAFTSVDGTIKAKLRSARYSMHAHAQLQFLASLQMRGLIILSVKTIEIL